MATTSKQASIARSVFFRTKGSNYTAFLHASTGNLIQEYDDDGNYYPEISPANPIPLTFTATSSRAAGVVVPDSISYKIGGVELAFDSTGACTTAGCAQYFRKDGADLVVIGNIADYLGNVSSYIEAVAKKGADDISAICLVDISKHQGGLNAKVAIAPGDNKNFTLSSQTDSVVLKAGVLKKSGWVYNSTSYKYLWEIADQSQPSGWRNLKLGTGIAGTLSVDADEVNTYANVRVTVFPASIADSVILGNSIFSAIPTGTDCVGILDASDPLDIVVNVKINKTGTGSEVDADELALDDSMPANAYLLLSPMLVVRGQNASAGPTTWLNGLLVDPAGVTTRNIVPSGGKYKLLVSDFGNILGEHTIVLTGQLT